ncbi:hypothetical protein BS50DRAFT_628888 [Corynespora cassiicola Philippines]|uniref:Nuclear pore assembly and biogenesis-domain-containing protein n=1 Tax=Corynespora cassiicola Philippines TaxID=1448308 RepID=A0A2T2P4X0_CORCC|nr:hypothetical protein BS50DRAFT_628888 [Corynespora cassiicola Philippines]
MDFIQDYGALLHNLLPPTLVSPLLTFLTTTFGLLKTAQTHLTPLLTRLTTQPDLASILALLAILFLSLKILDMAYRAVMFWVALTLRVVLWGGAAVVAWWVYTRGVEGFVEDLGALVEFWGGEVERYKGEVGRWKEVEERRIRMQAQQQQQQKRKGWR